MLSFPLLERLPTLHPCAFLSFLILKVHWSWRTSDVPILSSPIFVGYSQFFSCLPQTSFPRGTASLCALATPPQILFPYYFFLQKISPSGNFDIGPFFSLSIYPLPQLLAPLLYPQLLTLLQTTPAHGSPTQSPPPPPLIKKRLLFPPSFRLALPTFFLASPPKGPL